LLYLISKCVHAIGRNRITWRTLNRILPPRDIIAFMNIYICQYCPRNIIHVSLIFLNNSCPLDWQIKITAFHVYIRLFHVKIWN